jgi:hypothetical protein
MADERSYEVGATVAVLIKIGALNVYGRGGKTLCALCHILLWKCRITPRGGSRNHPERKEFVRKNHRLHFRIRLLPFYDRYNNVEGRQSFPLRIDPRNVSVS